MSSARRSATGWVLALTVLCLAAFGLRLVGIGYGAPLWEEGDAYFPGHVELIRKGVEVSKRTDDNVQYPSFVPTCVALVPERPVPPTGADREAHLEAARGTFVQVRTFSALMGVLAIPLVFLLTRRVAGPGWSLYAAAIVAVSFLHVGFSQQARPHATLATLFLATLMACMRLRARPTAANYLLAGTLAALSVGCLHSGAMMLVSLLVAHVLAERAGAEGGLFARLKRAVLEPRALLALAPIAASIPYFYAYAFKSELRESKEIFRIENGHVYMSTHKLSLEMWNGSGAASLLRILRTWEPELLVLLPLALVGLVLARGRGRTREGALRPSLPAGDKWVLASFVAPYLLLLVAYSRTYERFLMPVLPLAAAFSAWGAAQMGDFLAERFGAGARRALAAALVLLLALPLWASAHFVHVRSQPGTYERAGAWIEANLKGLDERIFVTPPFDLPLARSDAALRDERGKRRTQLFSVWSRYLNRLDESERPGPLYDVRWLVSKKTDGDLSDPARVDAYIDRHGPGLYVVEVARGARAHPFLRRLAEGLERRGELLERFSPDPDPYFSEHPLADEDEEVEDWPGFLWRSLKARSVGPVVEVYRVG